MADFHDDSEEPAHTYALNMFDWQRTLYDEIQDANK